MRIRAIELTNLRRFAGERARIDGIGDGVSVLSQPNEFGKSTFFDGLHALFFQPHRSTRAPVKSLQPHSGGAPEVAVEIDLPEGGFRLEKRWLGRQTARVLDASGRLIAQEDEAEAWIDRLTGQGLAGPSGLLWVRQGLLEMEPAGSSAAEKTERERALAARRDLLSSVAGEIELMTGGRRMDQVLARTGEELSRLATATLRPRAGGDWARAVDEAAALEAQRAALETKAARLSTELGRRAALLRELLVLSDPEAAARDQAAHRAAAAALAAAQTHAEEVRQADSARRLAVLTAEQGQAGILRLDQLRARLEAAGAAAQAASDALEQAGTLAAAAAAQEQAASAAHDRLRRDTAALAGRLDRLQRRQLAQAARERAATLAAVLGRAEAQRRLLEQHRAERSLQRVTAALLETAERAQAARDLLAMRSEARLVRLEIGYDGAARVLMDGDPLEPGGIRLHRPAELELPGIGRMRIDPGLSGGDDTAAELARAEAALAKAVAACGAPDLAAARAALAQALRLDAEIRQAEALLDGLAPDGLEALRAAHAAAASAAGDGDAELTAGDEDGDLAKGAPGAAAETGGTAIGTSPRPARTAAEDPAVLQQALEAARQAEEQALVLRREAEARHAAHRESRAGAEAAAAAASRSLEAIRADAGDPVTLAARLMQLSAAPQELDAAARLAGERLAALRAGAPDLATARAAEARLASVIEGRRAERIRVDSDLAGVNGSIGALADEGIEEALDELTGRLAAARARAARYEREVKALARLREALDGARRDAREAYFGPVLRELDPLLSILHPGAALRLDDASLLPVALSRDGLDEALDILSGGTREQLAVLTRLAFARLFARSGRPVPVILDDALVHSDDDRIEAMFTALHRVAEGQQIIVLTCRSRAFASLGGNRLTARISQL